MKNILVTGDWVADWNLARPANLPEGYFDGSLQTHLHHRAGGAWYVGELIEKVTCRDLLAARKEEVRVQCLRPTRDAIQAIEPRGEPSKDIAHAFSVWWKQARTTAGKPDDQVWRVARFAGCRKMTGWKAAAAHDGATGADVLVIDDLGLGFSESDGVREHVTSHLAKDGQVLLKDGVRARGSGLIHRLLERRLGDRLHVVVSARALRRRNAGLSRGLSWDRTLEDIESEMAQGPSARDLASCATAVVHFGLAGAAVFKSGKLYRFYFLPDELEGMWEEARPGHNFGTGSVLTACMARHLLGAEDYPLFFAVAQALAAQRTALDVGAGSGDSLELDFAYRAWSKPLRDGMPPAAACIAPPREGDAPTARHMACVSRFRAAWNPLDIQVWPMAKARGLRRTRLLCNVTGTLPDSLHAKAVEVVLLGPEKALASVPRACYDKYLTVDRDEIESINGIRRLILEYRANHDDRRPLSIAVFGAPGSGKSFAIKQVARTLFGKDKEPLEFNLAQIKTPEDLHRAFHQVRDASIRLEIPLVFWDEFDTDDLGWLVDFLAPMQDAEFFDGSHRHPFGKCIFVFAGGTRDTFEDFKVWEPGSSSAAGTPVPAGPWHPSFRARKGPDFVSRLRGFINVKGPNPTPASAKGGGAAAIASDPAYVLRRALVLRGEIERGYPQLLQTKTRRAAIAPNVLHALLSVERYEHGARSIGALLGMSALAGVRSFTVSALPTDDLLHLHVSQDFKSKLADPAYSTDLHEPLARAGFEAWKAKKQRQRYTHGKKRNDDPKAGPLTHPLIKEWTDLTPDEQASNYDPVWRRLLALRSAGYRLVPRSARPRKKPRRANAALVARLLASEHEIWLADHLATGYELAPATCDACRLHTDIRPFHELPDKQKDLNRSIVRATLRAIENAGFRLVRDK